MALAMWSVAGKKSSTILQKTMKKGGEKTDRQTKKLMLYHVDDDVENNAA